MRVPGWAKTASLLLLILVGGTVLWWQMQQDQSLLRIGGQRFHTTVMRTDQQLEEGLSDTDSLPTDEAMVFVFKADGKWPMWMKDMSYPIDILWLNSGKQVVHIVKNAQPSSYPKTEFIPDSPSRYVIEIASGMVDGTGVKIGDPVGLPSGI